jgi:hypothetical protein
MVVPTPTTRIGSGQEWWRTQSPSRNSYRIAVHVTSSRPVRQEPYRSLCRSSAWSPTVGASARPRHSAGRSARCVGRCDALAGRRLYTKDRPHPCGCTPTPNAPSSAQSFEAIDLTAFIVGPVISRRWSQPRHTAETSVQVPPGDLFHTKATGAVTLRACAAVGASGQPGGVAVMVAGEYVADQPPREKPRLTEPTHIVRFRTNTVVVRESHAERICR